MFQKEIASTVSPIGGSNPYPWALSFSDSFQFIPHAESLFKLISFLTVLTMLGSNIDENGQNIRR